MTLEARVVQQEHLSYGGIGTGGGSCWGHNHQFNVKFGQEDGLIKDGYYHCWPEIDGCWPEITYDANSTLAEVEVEAVSSVSGGGGGRKRKRRKRMGKEGDDQEILEKQRMTHIAVERNRRKQMNQHLAVLRSLMPSPYSQRGDQASIVGGAINFVKELEQHLQYLQAQYQHGHLRKKKKRLENHASRYTTSPSSADPAISIGTQNQCDDQDSVFGDFFQLPQCSTASAAASAICYPNGWLGRRRGVADVEVRGVERHSNLKIRCRRQPKQLLKLLTGLVALHLTILHLHVTTFDQTVLYSFNLKVENGCQLSTVDEIAKAVHDLMASIRNQAVFD